MQQDHPQLSWRGPVPVADAFDDPYYSLEDGLAESRYVFLRGNGLPNRFCPGFRIAELGFGTGLNVVAALAEWQNAGIDGPLEFTSFERFPMALDDMARALGNYPELAPQTEILLAGLAAGGLDFRSDHLALKIIPGDARQTLGQWDGQADAWFLDGFAPAKNPELWEPALLAELTRHTAPGGTAATYTAAGAVRRALGEAGFIVSRQSGFGRKRHMTVARLP